MRIERFQARGRRFDVQPVHDAFGHAEAGKPLEDSIELHQKEKWAPRSLIFTG
jgi:hypothetical protein